jgi:hypothetical protein
MIGTRSVRKTEKLVKTFFEALEKNTKIIYDRKKYSNTELIIIQNIIKNMLNNNEEIDIFNFVVDSEDPLINVNL